LALGGSDFLGKVWVVTATAFQRAGSSTAGTLKGTLTTPLRLEDPEASIDGYQI